MCVCAFYNGHVVAARAPAIASAFQVEKGDEQKQNPHDSKLPPFKIILRRLSQKLSFITHWPELCLMNAHLDRNLGNVFSVF